jgi:putative hydrolase of the HAD superfamily
VKVVLFDLDDTLFAHRESVASGITQYRRSLGGPIAAADARTAAHRWRELEEVHYHRYLSGELTFVEQRRERARIFAEEYGVILEEHEADAWFDSYFVEYMRAWTLHDDTIACLDAVAPLRIGIITNGDLAFQVAKIERIGLANRIEKVIASGELGFAKPDPRIFEHACRVFGVQPSEAAYVGDRLQTDAIGAASAGLLGVWLDRSRDASPEQLAAAAASAVPVINGLAELPAVLGLR